MRTKSRLKTTAVAAYSVVAAMFALFFLYLIIFENTNVYSVRNICSYTEQTGYQVKEISDAASPVGIRREYSWKLDDIKTNESCLEFYIMHQYCDVYFGDELMYSIKPQESNRLTKSISSSWVTVPIYPNDSGKEVRVILTPVYDSVKNFEVSFYVGSHSAIFLRQLKHDLPQIILSALCMIVGILIMIVHTVMVIRKKSDASYMFYLGSFSIILGIWRITDTRFSPLMFSGNTLVLGYISIGMLFIVTIPLLLFMKDRLKGCKDTPMLLMSIAASAIACVALILQVFGIAEFKQTLSLSHILILAAMITLIAAALIHSRQKNVSHQKSSWVYILMLAFGMLADMISFYFTKSSSGSIFMILAFIIYAVALFTENIAIISRNAFTDTGTGLINRSRWNQLLNNIADDESFAVIMIDINRLKNINDTYGHDVGDKIIFRFSEILKNAFDKDSVICRWGGDEFTVLMRNADKQKLERELENVSSAVDNYNESSEKPHIYYSVGYALSSEYSQLKRSELLRIADEMMYKNKQEWHALHPISDI
ncbi:MAG: GGDEF domain-containing protein [Acutalibacteraceae bacterium]